MLFVDTLKIIYQSTYLYQLILSSYLKLITYLSLVFNIYNIIYKFSSIFIMTRLKPRFHIRGMSYATKKWKTCKPTRIILHVRLRFQFANATMGIAPCSDSYESWILRLGQTFPKDKTHGYSFIRKHTNRIAQCRIRMPRIWNLGLISHVTYKMDELAIIVTSISAFICLPQLVMGAKSN